MKKQLILVGLTALILSCATTIKAGIFFDESVPLEKSSWLSTSGCGTIIGYNGIKVNWETTGPDKMISIPAGDTLLEWNISYYYSGGYIGGENILFRYNFQSQKFYTFELNRHDGIWGFDIHAWDFDEELLSGSFKKHFVGFVPFEGDIKSR